MYHNQFTDEEYEIGQQKAILDSLKQINRRVLKRPNLQQPPPVPPRPAIPNDVRIIIALTRRQVRNEQIVQSRHIQTHNIQSNEEYERVLQRSLTEYKKPFCGLQCDEMKVLRMLSRVVTRVVIKAAEPCVICSAEYQLQEQRTVLPCIHGFHSHCIERWLADNNTCPICKVNVCDQLKKCQ